MKQLVFEKANAEHTRHFELAYVALHTEGYQFKSREELRHHGKLLDAIDAITEKSDAQPGRKLPAKGATLVLDDEWLALWKRMASPESTRWLAAASREAAKMLDFLDSATDYVAVDVEAGPAKRAKK